MCTGGWDDISKKPEVVEGFKLELFAWKADMLPKETPPLPQTSKMTRTNIFMPAPLDFKVVKNIRGVNGPVL